MGHQPMQSFRDLDVWKIGHELVLDVYRSTSAFPEEERFGLVSQMRRAAVSVTSNVAEGFGRWSGKEKSRFYLIAKGSLIELHNQLIVSRDVGFLSGETYVQCEKRLLHVDRVLNGLIHTTGGFGR